MPWKWLSKPKYKNQGAVVPRRPLSAQEQPAVGWEAEGQKTTRSGRSMSFWRVFKEKAPANLGGASRLSVSTGLLQEHR